MLNRDQLRGLTTVAVGDLVLISATSGSLAVLADVAVGSILVSGGVGVVPGYATDIPTAVTIGSAYIYRAGGTDVPVADGGTGVGTFALNGVLYGNAGNPIGVTAIGTAGQILIAGASPFVPVFSSTITGTFGGFTASRAVLSDASGNLVAHATLTDTELGYLDGVTSPTGSGALVLGTSPTINASGGGAIQIPEGTPVNAVAAVGTITMSGIATANETFVVSTQTFTWKAARTGVGEVTIGADAPAAVTNIVTAITADLATVTATDGVGDTVVVTAVTKGVSGNSIIFTEASTNMAVNGTGTLGATTAGVDGTIGAVNELRADTTYLYHCIVANTITDANWRRVAIAAY